MKNKTRTILFLVASLILLVGVLTPVAVAREDVWGTDWLNPPFMYRLRSEMQLSASPQRDTSDEHAPAVAYNYVQKEYLVVWHNEWPGGSKDIYARRVSDSGQVLSWFAIPGTNNRLQPAVAYNAANNEYLVVWMYEASPNVYEIWGRIIPWNGPGTNAEFRIIQWTNRSFWTPRVAWNSYRNEYLVVWNAFDITSPIPLPGIPNDIAGYRVSASGVVQNHGSPLSLTTYASPHQVDMVYNVAMDEYFLAFVVVHTQATTGNDIYGLRVSWHGTPVNPPGLIHIYDGAKNQNAPAVATNEQNRYMVVWEHEYTSTDHDIYGREYNVDGTPDGSYFTISSWTQDDTVPDVAANGANKEWVAVWQRALPSGSGYSIHGFRWGSAGSSAYTYLFDVANWAFVECKNPAVAADIPGYLIVYEEKVPPNTFDIYGRLWWPDAVYLPLILRNKS